MKYFIFIISIPRILAGFGAQSATSLLSNVLLWGAPSILFEPIIGLWLLFKGVKARQRDNHDLESL